MARRCRSLTRSQSHNPTAAADLAVLIARMAAKENEEPEWAGLALGRVMALRQAAGARIVAAQNASHARLNALGVGSFTDQTGRRWQLDTWAEMARGLFHPNCTHQLLAYVPGLSRPVAWDAAGRRTENPEGYRVRQRERQRVLERRVRESKRRVAGLPPFGDTPELRRERALLTRRRRDLSVFNTVEGRKAWVSAQRTRTSAPPGSTGFNGGNNDGGDTPPAPPTPPGGSSGGPPDNRDFPPMGPTLGTPAQQTYTPNGFTPTQGRASDDANADWFHTYVPDSMDRTRALLTFHKPLEEAVKTRALQLQADPNSRPSVVVKRLVAEAYAALREDPSSGMRAEGFTRNDLLQDIEGAAHRTLALPSSNSPYSSEESASPAPTT